MGKRIFVGEQWKREWKLLCRYGSRICFWIVFAAFGGILLWVHGNAALVYQTGLLPTGVPALIVCFLLWLLAYALCGCTLGFLLLPPCFRTDTGRREGMLCLFIYLLQLLWYPLFFSMLHPFLCIFSLGAAVLLQIWMLVCSVRRFSLIMIAQFLSCLLEIYFLYVTFAVLLVH